MTMKNDDNDNHDNDDDKESNDSEKDDDDSDADVEARPAPKARLTKVKDTTYITDNPAPLGCANRPAKRLKLLEELQRGKVAPAKYKVRFAELMEDVAKSGKPKALLRVPLVYGSFVVMHGDRMQQIYEVSCDTPDLVCKC